MDCWIAWQFHFHLTWFSLGHSPCLAEGLRLPVLLVSPAEAASPLPVCTVAFMFLPLQFVLPAPKAPTKVTLAGHRLVIKEMFAGQLTMYSIFSLVLILLSYLLKKY